MAKPTLGYPSRTEAIIALRARGKTTREIADAIGISTATVSALEHSSARSRSSKRNQPDRVITLPDTIASALRPAATARSITVNHLVRQLLDAVVRDDIVDAVLDDGFREEFERV